MKTACVTVDAVTVVCYYQKSHWGYGIILVALTHCPIPLLWHIVHLIMALLILIWQIIMDLRTEVLKRLLVVSCRSLSNHIAMSCSFLRRQVMTCGPVLMGIGVAENHLWQV